MNQEIRLLVEKIDRYLDDTIDGDELEQFTMGLIRDDEFDSLDESIQDIIYSLDNKSLNQLSKEDIKSTRDSLKALLTKHDSV